MKSIILFRSNKSLSDEESYLKEKYAKFYVGHVAPSEKGIPIIMESPPIAQAHDHPELPAIILSKIRSGCDCVLEEINQRFLSREGEVVKNDFFSYLTREFYACPKDTVVLTRTTNLGEFYILFPEIIKEEVHDEKSGVSLVQIYDQGDPLYPLPPKEPVALTEDLRVAGGAYAITELKVVSSTRIKFGWTLPDDPSKNKEWWALYAGVMPSWKNLDQYENWDWVSPKNSGHGKTGTQTVTVSKMSSGAIYTFALFKWKWNVVDYQQFTAP